MVVKIPKIPKNEMEENDEMNTQSKRGFYLKIAIFTLFVTATISFEKEYNYLQGASGPSSSHTVLQSGEGLGGGLRISPSPTNPDPVSTATDGEDGEGDEEEGGNEGGDQGGGWSKGLKVAMLTVSANNVAEHKNKRYGEEKTIVTTPISIDNKVRYCMEHGWDLVIGGLVGDQVQEEDVRGRQMEGRSNRWLKVYHILRMFDDYDVILWMDLDTLMTTVEINMVEYFDGDKDLHLTEDWGFWDRINSGVFGFRTTDWARKFFEDVWEHNDGGKGVSDQRSINHVLQLRSKEEREAKVDIMDRSVYNAFPKIQEGENKYIVVGMVLPEVNVKLDGDANENTLVVHFAGAFAGCCNSQNKLPDGMLIQYVAMVSWG